MPASVFQSHLPSLLALHFFLYSFCLILKLVWTPVSQFEIERWCLSTSSTQRGTQATKSLWVSSMSGHPLGEHRPGCDFKALLKTLLVSLVFASMSSYRWVNPHVYFRGLKNPTALSTFRLCPQRHLDDHTALAGHQAPYTSTFTNIILFTLFAFLGS